jgi:hypothetical protein
LLIGLALPFVVSQLLRVFFFSRGNGSVVLLGIGLVTGSLAVALLVAIGYGWVYCHAVTVSIEAGNIVRAGRPLPRRTVHSLFVRELRRCATVTDFTLTSGTFRKTVPALLAMDGNGMCLFWLSGYFWPEQTLEAVGTLVGKPVSGAWTDQLKLGDIPGRSFGKAAPW